MSESMSDKQRCRGYNDESLKDRISLDQFQQLVTIGKIKVGDQFHNFDTTGQYKDCSGKIVQIYTESFLLVGGGKSSSWYHISSFR